MWTPLLNPWLVTVPCMLAVAFFVNTTIIAAAPVPGTSPQYVTITENVTVINMMCSYPFINNAKWVDIVKTGPDYEKPIPLAHMSVSLSGPKLSGSLPEVFKYFSDATVTGSWTSRTLSLTVLVEASQNQSAHYDCRVHTAFNKSDAASPDSKIGWSASGTTNATAGLNMADSRPPDADGFTVTLERTFCVVQSYSTPGCCLSRFSLTQSKEGFSSTVSNETIATVTPGGFWINQMAVRENTCGWIVKFTPWEERPSLQFYTDTNMSIVAPCKEHSRGFWICAAQHSEFPPNDSTTEHPHLEPSHKESTVFLWLFISTLLALIVSLCCLLRKYMERDPPQGYSPITDVTPNSNEVAGQQTNIIGGDGKEDSKQDDVETEQQNQGSEMEDEPIRDLNGGQGGARNADRAAQSEEAGPDARLSNTAEDTSVEQDPESVMNVRMKKQAAKCSRPSCNSTGDHHIRSKNQRPKRNTLP